MRILYGIAGPGYHTVLLVFILENLKKAAGRSKMRFTTVKKQRTSI